MATKASIEKSLRTQKYVTRVHHRCRRCGRPRAFMRDFGLCRICFRELALKQQIPGITKSSW